MDLRVVEVEARDRAGLRAGKVLLDGLDLSAVIVAGGLTPENVGAAIQKAMGTGKLVLVEKVTKGKLTFYEGHIASGGQTTEVKVDLEKPSV